MTKRAWKGHCKYTSLVWIFVILRS